MWGRQEWSKRMSGPSHAQMIVNIISMSKQNWQSCCKQFCTHDIPHQIQGTMQIYTVPKVQAFMTMLLTLCANQTTDELVIRMNAWQNADGLLDLTVPNLRSCRAFCCAT